MGKFLWLLKIARCWSFGSLICPNYNNWLQLNDIMISINLLGILGAQWFGYVNRSIPVSCNFIGRVNQNTSYAYFHNLHKNMLLTTWQMLKLLNFVIKKNEKLSKMTSMTSYTSVKILTQLLDHQHIVLWLFRQQLRIIEIPKYQHDWPISITGTCVYCVYGYCRNLSCSLVCARWVTKDTKQSLAFEIIRFAVANRN